MSDSLEDEFAPADYKLPDTNEYMKFAQGPNKIRILSSLVTGFVYWTKDDKPVRSPVEFSETPNIKTDKDGKTKIQHFWLVAVWNYATNRVQKLEITQTGIQKYILDLMNNADWGSPKGYDLMITRKGEGLKTKYTVAAAPHKPITDEMKLAYEKADIDLKKIFEQSVDSDEE